MRQVLPNHLWFSNASDVRDIRRLHELGVQAVVDLAVEETPIPMPREMVYCRLPLVDGEGNTPRLVCVALDTVALFIRKRVPSVVSCSAGLSRSPAIVAGALALVENETPESCLQRLGTICQLDVSPKLWEAVRSAHREVSASER